jgi:hypothetical protein
MESLPTEVTRYAELTHLKKQLNSKVGAINRELREIDDALINRMTENELDAYEICPSPEEEKSYGGIGALQLKLRNEYDRLSKANLTKFLIDFFKFAVPQADESGVVRLGHGICEWVWSNRGRKPKKWLDRVYLEDMENKAVKKKRAASQPLDGEPEAKKTKLVDIPRTREEFMALPVFQEFTSMVGE